MTGEETAVAAEPAWLAGIREGRAEAREAFAAHALPRVVRWCRRLAGPRVDPEDAAHEVMLVALDKVTSLGPAPNVDAWLFAICRRVLANHRRRAWVQRWSAGFMGLENLSGGALDPEVALVSSRRTELARRCLDQLSRRQREALVLYDLEERSAREVGEILDLSPEAVRALVMRSRRKLKGVARKAGYRPEEEGAR